MYISLFFPARIFLEKNYLFRNVYLYFALPNKIFFARFGHKKLYFRLSTFSFPSKKFFWKIISRPIIILNLKIYGFPGNHSATLWTPTGIQRSRFPKFLDRFFHRRILLGGIFWLKRVPNSA